MPAKNQELGWILFNLRRAIEKVQDLNTSKHKGIPVVRWSKELSKSDRHDIGLDILKLFLTGFANKYKLPKRTVKGIVDKYRKIDFTQVMVQPKSQLELAKLFRNMVVK